MHSCRVGNDEAQVHPLYTGRAMDRAHIATPSETLNASARSWGGALAVPAGRVMRPLLVSVSLLLFSSAYAGSVSGNELNELCKAPSNSQRYALGLRYTSRGRRCKHRGECPAAILATI